jgi:hypothetical protein
MVFPFQGIDWIPGESFYYLDFDDYNIRITSKYKNDFKRFNFSRL